MKIGLDMDKIARGLGTTRRGKVAASGGYFGAIGLLADVKARFRVPAGGGRPTDTSWTERRLVPLAPRTLKRLEDIAAEMRSRRDSNMLSNPFITCDQFRSKIQLPPPIPPYI